MVTIFTHKKVFFLQYIYSIFTVYTILYYII